MKLTTERLKQIIREEIEEALRTGPPPERTPLKFKRGKKVGPRITFPPPGSGKEETEAPTGKSGKIRFHKDPKTGKMVPVGKTIRRKEKQPDFNLSGKTASPLSGRKTVSPDEEEKAAALSGPTAAPEETEFERDQRQRREQELYKENISSLEERIFKMLVAKINGASK